uniref:6-beta-hydroxyhyoscyamine epoxidase n=1 Tax=Opuntia streptacantha TaxID=393608 RepID=A0A7C9AMP4_OPUST
MEKFVSSWSNGTILPESYIFPPGKRPGKQVVPLYDSVPVIDLGKADGDDHENIVHQIIEAAREYGFLQVINHGVPTRLMDATRRTFKEFFELPTEEKTRFLSLDPSQTCALYTSNVDYEKEEIHNWRDSLRHSCNPLEECMHYWPEKPSRYREVVGEYTVKVRELGSRILELICEGLGLEQGFFAKELSQGQVMAVHHYPPCPDPSLTLGTRQHYDPGLITILLQGNVSGLQVLRNGEWIGVEAIPDAFVVNIGQQLQIVSNGRLRSSEHRAVTNKTKARITAAFFIEPTKECIVEPAKAIVNAQSPAIYRRVRYEDFLGTFRGAYVGEIDDVLEPYTIRA